MAYPFELPDLGYDHDALEPYIDARTRGIHHGKHHAAYTNNLNAALADHSDFHGHSCLLYTSPSPRDLSTSRMPSSA